MSGAYCSVVTVATAMTASVKPTVLRWLVDVISYIMNYMKRFSSKSYGIEECRNIKSILSCNRYIIYYKYKALEHFWFPS